MRSLVLVLLVAGSALAAEPVLIPRPDAFATLVNPDCSHCRDEAKRRAQDLRADDRVLCWLRGYSDGGAIPFRFFLNPYRVISDTYGVFVFDAEAGYARGFAPSVDFRFHGWRNGVMVMKHKDGTLYSCLTGLAFDGPNKGQRLTPVPTLTSTWGEWLTTYPQAVAYHMFDKYQPVEVPAQPHADSLKSRGKVDARLPAETLVLGVHDNGSARAYPLDALAKEGLLRDKVGGRERVLLWHPGTKTAAAYAPVATPPKGVRGEPRPLTLERTGKETHAPFTDKETGSRWDIAGRAVAGDLQGWTLTWLDGVQVKWFAWAAEYPATELHGQEAPKPEEKMSEVAGSAEVLFAVPKKFAALQAVDVKQRTVKLLLDGDKEPTDWRLQDDAEIKVRGWWGRLDQFTSGQRVWAWFQLDRRKKPVALLMLADEASEQDIHGSSKAAADEVEKQRREQKQFLAARWERDGLPGTLTFVHISGEVEMLLDHEAMRWGRSLQVGDKVTLTDEPPVAAVVKSVKPWRERTQLRLVIKGLEIGDLKIGQRLGLKMTTPPAQVSEAALPPDVDRTRTKEERLDWFLASIYCPCKVKGDRCTGMFYTLASCNPNGCGLPNGMRSLLGKKIDQGMTDRQIFEELLKTYGPEVTRPHLLR